MQASDGQETQADQIQSVPSHNTQSAPTTHGESSSTKPFIAPSLNPSRRQETFRSADSRRTFNPVPRRPTHQQLFDENEPWRPKNVLTLGEQSRLIFCIMSLKYSRWWGDQRLLQPPDSKTSYDHGQTVRAEFHRR